METVAHLGGAVYDLRLQENHDLDYAYMGEGTNLTVLDIIRPMAPRRVGMVTLPTVVRGVFVLGDYVYVADGKSGLWIVNVTDRTHPQIVSHLETPGQAMGVHVVSDYANPQGAYAYLACGQAGGLQVVDVRDKAHPQVVGSYDTSGQALAVDVFERRAYLADGDAGVMAFNIADPGQPLLMGMYDTPGYARSVRAVGSHVYVADGPDGLRILDMGDPTNPRELAWVDTPGETFGVTVQGDYGSFEGGYAYVADGEAGGVRVIDLRTLNEVDAYTTPGEARVIRILDRYGFVADGYGGLTVLPCATCGRLATSTPTVTASVTVTMTPTVSSTPSVTPTVTSTATSTVTSTPSPTPNPTPTATETITPTATPTSTPSPPQGDPFESDDTCEQASLIAVDGQVQRHTFHIAGDQDWIRFQVQAGTTYVIETTDVGPDADTQLVLYERCAGDPLVTSDPPMLSTACIVWTAPTTDTYRLQIQQHDPARHGPAAYYTLGVRQGASGVGIIVAGDAGQESLQANVDYVANHMYRALLLAGIPEDRIHYLSPEPDRQDPDQDGIKDDVDAPATAANVQDTFLITAAHQLGPDVPLYLYLVGLGEKDRFEVADASDVITATKLGGWIQQLEDATGVRSVNVVIEADRAGSFIDDLAGEGRVIIASTGENEAAFSSDWGAVFSDAFLEALAAGDDFWASFQAGQTAVITTGNPQTPQLDDDGNGVPNEPGDGAVAQTRLLQVPRRWLYLPNVEWGKVNGE